MIQTTNTPLVCICIPTFNAEATIAETMASVLAQTYTNFVLKIVDNHSDDTTLRVAASFKDPRIEILPHGENIGGEGNFTRCIRLGCGDYLAIYHADDVYGPGMIEAQVAFLEDHKEARAVFTNASTIDENGHRTGSITHPSELVGPLFDFGQILKAVMKHSNFLVCPSVMARTPIYTQAIQRWRGDLFGSSADLDVWFRMLAVGPIGILRRELMQYRISTQQWSARVRAQTSRADFFRVMDHYLSDPTIRGMVSPADFENYARLDRRDLVVRAANAMIAGDTRLAKSLCPTPWARDVMSAALRDRRSTAVLILAAFIRAALALRLSALGGWTLAQVKALSRR